MRWLVLVSLCFLPTRTEALWNGFCLFNHCFGGNTTTENDKSAIDHSKYNIDNSFSSDFPEHGKAAFADAVAKWESIISGDVPDYNTFLFSWLPSACGTLPSVIDDVFICSEIRPLGPRILAMAGPMLVRSQYGTAITVSGRIHVAASSIDRADFGDTIVGALLSCSLYL